MKEEILCCT